MNFSQYVKYYFGRNISVKELTEEQYEIVSAAYAEECAEDPDNFGDDDIF